MDGEAHKPGFISLTFWI